MKYVYVYKDPKDLQPFYVGMGRGERMFNHLYETVDNTENYVKWCKIQSILQEGNLPIIEICFYSNNAEVCAEKEKELIVKFGRKVDGSGILTNISSDTRPGKMTTEAAKKAYQTRIKNGNDNSGERNGMYGKRPWNYGYTPDQETRDAIGEANRGRKYTEEEADRRMKSRGKIWKVIDPSGKEHIVKNLKMFCRNRNLSYINLRLVLKQKPGHLSYRGYSGMEIGWK